LGDFEKHRVVIGAPLPPIYKKRGFENKKYDLPLDFEKNYIKGPIFHKEGERMLKPAQEIRISS